MEALIFLILIGIIVVAFRGKKTSNSKSGRSGGPIVMRSDNGYEGHLDFLEMHGAISPEERQAQRDFEKDYRENPHKYKTVTLEELLQELKSKNPPKKDS